MSLTQQIQPLQQQVQNETLYTVTPATATCIMIAAKKQLQSVPHGVAGFSETYQLRAQDVR